MTRTMRIWTRVDGVESSVSIPLPNIPIEDIDMVKDMPKFCYPDRPFSHDANGVYVHTVCDMENEEEREKNKEFKRMGFMSMEPGSRMTY